MDVFAQAVREVLAGLPNERESITDAQLNTWYYEGQNLDFVPRREGESVYDYCRRPKRISLITKQVIDVLGRHLYKHAPERKALNVSAESEAMLERIWDTCYVDALWCEADKQSTLNDYCAFQFAGSDDPQKPIRVHFWGRDELAVWVAHDDPTRPVAVCTIDRYDATTRYRLWDDTRVQVFQTKKLDLPAHESRMNPFGIGLVAPRAVGPAEQHGYGTLPFSFVHAHQPIRRFHTYGIGTPLREANTSIDRCLSNLDEAVEKLGRPITIAYDVDPEFRPTIRAGSFVRVVRTPTEIGDAGPDPRLETLQFALDIEGLWLDASNQLDHTLECHGVPKSAVRMVQDSASSGVAILYEQAPLLARAESRESLYLRFETEFAKTALRVAGAHWGRGGWVTDADRLKLQITRPVPAITMPGSERDASDRAEIEMGIASRVEILARRRGITLDQAREVIAEIAEDERRFADLVTVRDEPAPEPEPSPVLEPTEVPEEPNEEEEN